MQKPIEQVVIEDETLRDGLQNEKIILSVDHKLSIVDQLVAAGVRRIQVGSFVHPERVPAMANTDQVFKHLKRHADCVYTALVLNRVGLDRALKAGVEHLSISVSASETHSKRNLNKSVDDACLAAEETIRRALASGVAVRAGIQSALGCAYEGPVDRSRVVTLARRFAALGVSEINIADTAGMGSPSDVSLLCSEVKQAVRGIALSLHLHDTRGLGLANMMAGLQVGVRIFDSALGGLGGCPFIPDAAGNIATEDVAYLCARERFETGVRWPELRNPVANLEKSLDRKLGGKASQFEPPSWMIQETVSGHQAGLR